MSDERTIRKVRKKLDKALSRGRDEEATVVLAKLIELEPGAPRWPHKLGDINRKLGKTREAVMAYSKAVDLYADQGFIARAIAMAKTVLNLDPKRLDILERVDPEAARQLHREARPSAASVAPPMEHPAAQSDSPAAHPAIRAQGASDHTAAANPAIVAQAAVIQDGAPRKHPAVIDDGDAGLDAAPPLPPPQQPTQEQIDRQTRARALQEQQAQDARQQAEQRRAEQVTEQHQTAQLAQEHARAVQEQADEGAREQAPVAEQETEVDRAAALQTELEAQQKRTAELMAQLDAEKQRSAELAAQQQTPTGVISPEAAIPTQRKARGRPITLENLELPPKGRPVPAGDGEMLVIPGAPKLPTVGGIYSSVLDSIDELAIAPDVGSDEVRFSNAPPRHTVEIDLTDLEVTDRSSGTGGDGDVEAADEPSARALSKLPLFPLFAEVPKAALGHLIRGAELVELEDGEMLMRRGDAADALFGIVEGTVRVMARGKNMYLTLSEGDVLGEACLLQDEPRHADVRAQGKVTALRIPRDVLHEVLQQHPPLGEVLLELLTRRLLGNLLQTSPLFQDFDTSVKQQLARAFEIRRAAAGTFLTEVGKRMDGLYIALTGRLTVTVPGEEPRTEGAGAMFGQDALISRNPSQCNIQAQVNMVVLRLPADAFLRIAMEHPTIIDRLSQLSDQNVVNVSL